MSSVKIKPLVKHFPILAIDNKNGFKKEDFLCPEIFGCLHENTFKHTFKNGVSSIVTKCKRFTYNRSIFQHISQLDNVQSVHPQDSVATVRQYSDEFGGFITVFVKEF